MERLQLKQELRKELLGKSDIFIRLWKKEPALSKFGDLFDPAKETEAPDASKMAPDEVILKLIALYRKLHEDKSTPMSIGEQQVILGILLLVFWEDMQFLRGKKRVCYWLFRLGEPFPEVYFAYLSLIAEGDITKPATFNLHQRMLYLAEQFIHQEYKKQCVYEI